MWIKVKAMKALTIQSLFHGNGSFGTKSISEAAALIKKSAGQHPVNFQPPVVVFWFVKGITDDVAYSLQSMNIVVRGEKVEEPTEESSDEDGLNLDKCVIEEEKRKATAKEKLILLVEDTGPDLEIPNEDEEHEIPKINKVNLDITTLITLVSHVTNDLDPSQSFDDPVLQYQAEEERKQKVLPLINEFIAGKEVIVTNSAWTKFEGIVSIVGGPKERERTEELRKTLKFVEDCPSEYSLQLPVGGKIKQQHIDIFGSGDYYKAVTVTANSALVRAAADHGVEFSTFLHQARALTEVKVKYLESKNSLSRQ
eukprot:TRINITY_DN4867_c0_g1_i4.p1 TRINITY_DN4867_c0_g1~~TRINITY_DN4867_c0_g1_i4.p1  ORF type:complete len:311 (-),score=67.22 TRINITY_DN4867_c0_g1_i4:38-970(-)